MPATQLAKKLTKRLDAQARSREEFVSKDTLELRLVHVIGHRLKRHQAKKVNHPFRHGSRLSCVEWSFWHPWGPCYRLILPLSKLIACDQVLRCVFCSGLQVDLSPDLQTCRAGTNKIENSSSTSKQVRGPCFPCRTTIYCNATIPNNCE